jgi:hypothetical protein
MSRSGVRLAAVRSRGVVRRFSGRGVTADGSDGGRVDRIELVVLGVFAAMSVSVLAIGLWWTLTQGRVWTGVNWVYVQDVTQYLAWIRDAARHVLVSNLFVLRTTPHDYPQPAIVVSGGLVAIGVAPWLALLLWQPVAVGGVFFAVSALVRHQFARAGRSAGRRGARPVRRDLWLPWEAIGYLARDPEPGGVLTGFSLGATSRRKRGVAPTSGTCSGQNLTRSSAGSSSRDCSGGK